MSNTGAKSAPAGGYEVLVPRDAEADMITYLSPAFTASTRIFEGRGPGQIRVQRIGGDLVHQGQRDRPLMLFEVWETRSDSAWDLAMRLWAFIRILEYYPDRHPSGAFHDLDIQVPRSHDDPDAPDLFRLQFTVEATVGVTTLGIGAPGDQNSPIV